jgi:cytochrome P450
MDAPDHTLYRRMLATEFTARRVRGLRPYIQSVVDDRVDRLLAGDRPADLVTTLALAVPSLVICELLGVPYADRSLFQGHTGVVASHHSTSADRLAAMGELRTYLRDLVAVKEREPGGDLLSELVARYAEAGVTDHDHLAGMAVFLLIAGHETTANMIALSTVALATNPEQLAAFTEDPAGAPRAVDELLRFLSNLDHVARRVAADDIELGGVTIRRGDGVIVLNAAANHDATVFECPHRLDVRRDARRHIAFSFGAHQCLGQHLARLELEITLTTLFRRIPGLRLAVPVATLPFKDDTSMYGLHEVPVTW